MLNRPSTRDAVVLLSDQGRPIGQASRLEVHTGTTPLQWQLRQRVDLAQGLLCGSGLSVAEIADRLGFTDQAHLTRVFRQVTGATPAAWASPLRAWQTKITLSRSGDRVP